MSALSFRL